VYAVEWEPGEIRWYRDGILYHTARPDLVKGAWVYEHPFFVILNLAVGGYWPGNPDASTSFPQRMLVDYVRVYRRAGFRVRGVRGVRGGRQIALARLARDPAMARRQSRVGTPTLRVGAFRVHARQLGRDLGRAGHLVAEQLDQADHGFVHGRVRGARDVLAAGVERPGIA
jgi:hypothetical protein